jgi:D-alanyl-lipoteichoic acid acyltransferase DltB (MBOAT superfamily)
MLFNSYVFIFAFLPLALAGYLLLRRLPNITYAIGFLTVASLIYYAWWKVDYVLIVLTSIAVNAIFARQLISGGLTGGRSKALLGVAVTFNLCLLGYFKYADFFVVNMNAAFGAGWALPGVVLPIGISFVTFQIIAYLVDAHQGKVEKFTPLNFSFFVTFFPQLIAGPIVHHKEIMPQLADAPRRDFAADFAVGSAIFIVGLFKKVIIADTVAVYADAGYATLASGQPLDFMSAWITVLSYSFQLYFDFSGYSDMAVGLARMFGIKLPVNFYSPYRATSFIDFWRRWHITLSRFLRDYLYIPLGGNRQGRIRRYLNLFVVMFLGGLWHGAAWTFALWGVIHGLLLAVNHAWNALPFSRYAFMRTGLARVIAIGFVFFCVTLAWVPFRASDFPTAATMFSHLLPTGTGSGAFASIRAFLGAQLLGLFDAARYADFLKPRELWPPVLPPDYLATKVFPIGIVLAIVGAITFFMPNTYRLFGRFDPALGLEGYTSKTRFAIARLGMREAIVLAGMFVMSVLALSRVSPFLYFQF